MPAHLRRFHPDDWPDQPEPAWCVGNPLKKRAGYRIASKWRLWVDAGKAWCAEHGGDWYALTRPGPVVRRRRSGG